MNPRECLVLVKSKDSDEWNDKTYSISSYRETNTVFCIAYSSNPKQEYFYSKSNNKILFFDNPIDIEIRDKDVFIKTFYSSNVESIVKFGTYKKIFLKNGNSDVFENDDIQLRPTCLSNPISVSIMNYFKTISEYVSVDDEEAVSGRTSFLATQFRSIDHVPSDSFLSTYLQQHCIESVGFNDALIFPFGFNLSQLTAVEHALHYKGSVIEGPPGTGKTQTILNIICNLVISKRSVAVVSNNNSAIQNIKDKLEKHGLGFLCAFLGNFKNKTSFFKQLPQLLRDMEGWELPDHHHEKLLDKIVPLQLKLRDLLHKNNQLAILKSEWQAFKTEYTYFLDHYSVESTTSFSDVSLFGMIPNHIPDALAYIDFQSYLGRLDTFFVKIKLFFKYRIIRFELLEKEYTTIIGDLKYQFYEFNIGRLDKEIKNLERTLNDADMEALQSNYSALCMQYFKSSLAKKFKTLEASPKFVISNLGNEKIFSNFQNYFPVILSTTHSILKCKPQSVLFDYVIVDECSQVDLVTGTLGMLGGKRVVFVGDLKQLPPIIPTQKKLEFNDLSTHYSVSDSYNYVT